MLTLFFLPTLLNVEGGTVWAAEEMSPREFVSTLAAEYFKSGNYGKASESLEVLKRKYPDDVRVRRYLGISYFKLGQLEKAAENFKEALGIDPANIAAHFYLAETYLTLLRLKEAGQAYEYVVAQDPESRYAAAAIPKIELLERPLEEIANITAAVPQRKWRLSASAGYAYDDNATFNPRDADQTSLADQNAGQFMSGVEAAYDLYTSENWDLDIEYAYDQSFYDDSLRQLNTYSNSWTAAVTHVYTLWGTPVIAYIRDTLSHVILNKKFFLFVNSFSVTFIVQPHPKYQVTALYSLNYNEFEDNTERQDLNGRDGFGNSVILLNTIYLNEERTLRFTFGWDYLHDDTQGGNFIRDVHGAGASLNFPFFFETSGEVRVHYRHDERPSFAADTIDGPRRDDIWDLSVNFTRPLTEHLSIDVFYDYTRVFGQNNAFEYIRSSGGSKLRYDF